MEYEIIYKKVINLLWKIMPSDAKEIYFLGAIYNKYMSGGARWLTHNGGYETFPFDERPDLIEKEIRDLMLYLYNDPIFNSNNWSQYTIKLSENGEFMINYYYIPEEDSWPDLHGRSISELSWEEAYEHYIPKEIWEERVRIKNSKS